MLQIVHRGSSIDKVECDRLFTDMNVVKEFIGIIHARDIEALRKFKTNNPDVTLYHGYTSACNVAGCDCRLHAVPIKSITASAYYKDSHLNSYTPNIISESFYDALFELGYITDNDIYIIFHMLTGLSEYEKWNDVNYLMKKMNPDALKSTRNGDWGENVFLGIADGFYSAYCTHYNGKIDAGAIKCFKMINSLGIYPHDIKTGDEISHESQTNFWDIPASIESFKIRHPDVFNGSDCDIEYWNSLPSSFEEIMNQ